MAKNGNGEKEMDGVQKAAVLLIALGPEKSSKIFKHLKEEEIEQLTLEIANTNSVSPQTKEEVLNEFYEICLAQQYIAEGGIGYAKELLEKAQKLFAYSESEDDPRDKRAREIYTDISDYLENQPMEFWETVDCRRGKLEDLLCEAYDKVHGK